MRFFSNTFPIGAYKDHTNRPRPFGQLTGQPGKDRATAQFFPGNFRGRPDGFLRFPFFKKNDGQNDQTIDNQGVAPPRQPFLEPKNGSSGTSNPDFDPSKTEPPPPQPANPLTLPKQISTLPPAPKNLFLARTTVSIFPFNRSRVAGRWASKNDGQLPHWRLPVSFCF